MFSSLASCRSGKLLERNILVDQQILISTLLSTNAVGDKLEMLCVKKKVQPGQSVLQGNH